MLFQNMLHQCLNRVKETSEKMMIKRQECTKWAINTTIWSLKHAIISAYKNYRAQQTSQQSTKHNDLKITIYNL